MGKINSLSYDGNRTSSPYPSCCTDSTITAPFLLTIIIITVVVVVVIIITIIMNNSSTPGEMAHTATF
jgi:hypothetical protein